MVHCYYSNLSIDRFTRITQPTTPPMGLVLRIVPLTKTAMNSDHAVILGSCHLHICLFLFPEFQAPSSCRGNKNRCSSPSRQPCLCLPFLASEWCKRSRGPCDLYFRHSVNAYSCCDLINFDARCNISKPLKMLLVVWSFDQVDGDRIGLLGGDVEASRN